MNINDETFLNRLVSVIPDKRQTEWQRLEYYNFIHFGMNTFTGREWGSGKDSPSIFNPVNADTDQWTRVLKASGSKGVIFTAKHHDGFCLFPSKYTDYSIKNSPYKNGKGDFVKELQQSCAKYGLKFGVYLSPWDRHEASYGTAAYNDYFCNQLEELLTGNGEIFAVWLDGACGEGKNGLKQTYDFERYYALIRKLQPDAVISICGPDVRWIGNEGGHCRKSEFSVCDKKHTQYSHVSDLSQQEDNSAEMNKKPDETREDIASREKLLGAEELIWYPAETDVSITRYHWFYNKWAELFLTRTVSELKRIYLNSVGHNSALLLNVPPNKKGLISKRFENRLKKLGQFLATEFSNPVNAAFSIKTDYGKYMYEVGFDTASIRKIVLGEDLTKSQRIESFEIFTEKNNRLIKLAEGFSIGYKEIALIKKTECDNLKIVINRCRCEPHLSEIKIYK